MTQLPIAMTTRPADRARWVRRAQLLALATVAYNVVECLVAVWAGRAAGSTSLVGFGLDSAVEVSSGLIILWQFRHPVPESRERAAQRAMAVAFLALAAFVGWHSAGALLSGERPDTSVVGMVLAAASLVIMPVLSAAQRKTGRALGSGAVVADSTQTLLCTYLSAVLLVGLALNATLGWWWADPIAGLAIAVVAFKEGREAWRGEGCCASPSWGAAGDDPGCSSGCACCTDEGCGAPDRR